MQTTTNAKGGEFTHIDEIDELIPTKPLPAEKKEAHLPDTDINAVPQKKSVFLTWLLSCITLNIYSALWYAKKVPEFYNLGTQKKISKNLPLILLIVNIMFIICILIFPVTITENMGTFYQHLSTIQTIILFAIGIFGILKLFFSLLLAFYSRTVINQALENKGSKTRASALFTLIFTHIYLQYEVNRILEDKEDMPKIGPWIFLLLIVIFTGAAVAYQYFLV